MKWHIFFLFFVLNGQLIVSMSEQEEWQEYEQKKKQWWQGKPLTQQVNYVVHSKGLKLRLPPLMVGYDSFRNDILSDGDFNKLQNHGVLAELAYAVENSLRSSKYIANLPRPEHDPAKAGMLSFLVQIYWNRFVALSKNNETIISPKKKAALGLLKKYASLLMHQRPTNTSLAYCVLLSEKILAEATGSSCTMKQLFGKQMQQQLLDNYKYYQDYLSSLPAGMLIAKPIKQHVDMLQEEIKLLDEKYPLRIFPPMKWLIDALKKSARDQEISFNHMQELVMDIIKYYSISYKHLIGGVEESDRIIKSQLSALEDITSCYDAVVAELMQGGRIDAVAKKLRYLAGQGHKEASYLLAIISPQGKDVEACLRRARDISREHSLEKEFLRDIFAIKLRNTSYSQSDAIICQAILDAGNMQSYDRLPEWYKKIEIKERHVQVRKPLFDLYIELGAQAMLQKAVNRPEDQQSAYRALYEITMGYALSEVESGSAEAVALIDTGIEYLEQIDDKGKEKIEYVIASALLLSIRCEEDADTKVEKSKKYLQYLMYNKQQRWARIYLGAMAAGIDLQKEGACTCTGDSCWHTNDISRQALHEIMETSGFKSDPKALYDEFNGKIQEFRSSEINGMKRLVEKLWISQDHVYETKKYFNSQQYDSYKKCLIECLEKEPLYQELVDSIKIYNQAISKELKRIMSMRRELKRGVGVHESSKKQWFDNFFSLYMSQYNKKHTDL